MRALLHRLWADDSGQGMVEYGLIIALVAIVVIAAVRAIGGSLRSTFQSIESELTTATP